MIQQINDIILLYVIKSYLCTDSRRTRRRRTKIYRRATTWRNFSGCGRGPGKLGPRSGSNDRMASICSDCARDQIYNSREPGGRRFEIVLLQTHNNDMKKLLKPPQTTSKHNRPTLYLCIYVHTITQAKTLGTFRKFSSINLSMLYTFNAIGL